MSAGLLDSARSLGANLISLGATRFELFGVELREEIARLSAAILGGLAVLVLAALGLGFAALALILTVGPEHRLTAVWIVAACFAGGAVALALALLHAARAKPRAFDATLSELRRDYEAIKP